MKKLAGILLIGALGCSAATDPGSRVPQAPTNLSITKTSAGLHITWLDRSSVEDFYRVEVSVNNGAWSQLIETVANVVSTDLANPLPSTRYAFRVSACNQLGCSTPLEGSIVTADLVAVSITISQVIKIAPDGVQLNVQLPSHMAAAITMTVRRAGDPQVVFTRTDDWQPNLPLTVDFYFFGLDPSVSYEAEATLASNTATGKSTIRTFRLADM